ncbi:MAG TPA: hypothetical protein VFZ48_01330 [Candidatus Saccharimonadales bacterium]
MELGNIHRDSYDTLQREVTANSSSLLFSRVASVAGAMANPSLRTERELNRLLKPYRDEAESLTAATAAWAVAVLTAEDNMTPTEVAALVSLCVRETHPHDALPIYFEYESWLRTARSENHSGCWPVIAAVWFADMTYPRRMSLHRAAVMLGKVAGKPL